MTVLLLDFLSPTQIGRLLSCEQRYVFRYVDGLKEPGSEAMATGIGFAEAVEHRSVNRGIASYLETRPPVDAVWDDEEVRENERMVAEATIVHASQAYLERYPDVDVKREVEYVVSPAPGSVVLYVRADGEGPGFMVEDKLRSGSSLGAEKIEMECANSHQLTAEVFVRWRKTGQLLPVKFRLLRKPDRRKTKALKLDEGAINELVRAHFFDGDRGFDERTITRTIEDMYRFEAELERLWERRRELRDGMPPVRNPEACFSFGRVCPFAEQCIGLSAGSPA